MEEDKEYINALSVIRELEEQLAYLNDTSLLQKDRDRAKKEIEINFQKCAQVLLARKTYLLSKLDDMVQNKEKENERLVPKVQSALLGSNKLLKAGMKVYNINYGAGRNTFKGVQDMKPSILKKSSFEVCLPVDFMSSIGTYGEVVEKGVNVDIDLTELKLEHPPPQQSKEVKGKEKEKEKEKDEQIERVWKKKIVIISWHAYNPEVVKELAMVLTGETKVGEVINKVRVLVALDKVHGSGIIRLLEVHNNRIQKVFDATESISTSKEYNPFRAEEIPKEEIQMDNLHRRFHVIHYSSTGVPHGKPFFQVAKKDETISKFKKRIEKRLGLLESFAVVSFLGNSTCTYLGDDDVVGSLEFDCLALEHS